MRYIHLPKATINQHISSSPFNTGAPPAMAEHLVPLLAMRLPDADWPEIDVSILDEERGAVRPFR